MPNASLVRCESVPMSPTSPAKAAENAARIAGVLWVFEHGPCGQIDAETMEAGAAIASWHLHEAKRIVGCNPGAASEVSDAGALRSLDPETRPRPQRRAGTISPRDILPRRAGPTTRQEPSRRRG